MNWEEAYFETLAKLQQEIVKNMKLKEEIARLRWEANIQDQIDIWLKLVYNTCIMKLRKQMKMKTDATVNVVTFYRKSTKEWVGEVNYNAHDTDGCARYPAPTENEARNAAYAAIGYLLLETTWAD